MSHRARFALVPFSTLVLVCLVAPGATATDGRLAATGVDVLWVVVGAVAVVVVGVVAVLLGRRGRK
ncbi:hypothetical protein [Georgenia sp. H159]|uniref:hypothetical protein n=1 Tax=Georgenia sp. H159 TaxID=3076115 RepID=UPI002D780E7F|nr:hypothetical protein [Georgenia sp. H159]